MRQARAGVLVGVRPMGDGIEVRFKWKGKTWRPRLRLAATKANLMHADRLRKEVLHRIAQGTFSMVEHFPDYRFAADLQTITDPQARTFAEWAQTWATLSERDLEHSTLHIYKQNLRTYWVPAFGLKRPGQITNEMVLAHLAELAREKLVDGVVKPGLSRKSQNNILIPLRAVFAMACRADRKLTNPMDGIDNLKVQTGAPDPFTIEEVELALRKVEHRFGQALRDYFEFAAFAGLRGSEQIALLWADVDLRTATVSVRRSKVMLREKERTKTTRARLVELNERAAGVIQRQRARTQVAGAHVFLNPVTKRPWNDQQEQRRDWELALRAAGIRYRPPKELRDTSVTMALQAGADPWYVAQQHGHSLQVMQKDYAKWMPNADRGRNRDKINGALRQGAA